MTEPVCLIKCTDCKRLFPSRTQFGTADAFYTGNLARNEVQCRKCGENTPCNRENSYFNPRDRRIATAQDTTPDQVTTVVSLGVMRDPCPPNLPKPPR